MRSLDMTTLLHEIFFCQDHLDETARRRQPLVIKKRGSYAYISYDIIDTIPGSMGERNGSIVGTLKQ
jgi:hypothetical protein